MATLSTPVRAHALRCIRALNQQGHLAYLVGGCVRDQLLGLDPKDYDIATDATPERVQAIFPKTVAIGKAFGVVMVLDPDTPQLKVEVATFRSDGHYLDGRHPDSVVFSTPEEDARRRDFTINGLFYDPDTDRVIDFVGGQTDIAGRLIRAIGNPHERFGEDKLRVLRAIRFACRFAFAIDPATFSAIGEFVPMLSQVSFERIRDELDAMLCGPGRGRAWALLYETGVVDQVLAELAACLQEVGQPGATLEVMEQSRLSPQQAWAILLIAVYEASATGPALVADVLRRMRKPNASIESTLAMLMLQPDIAGARERRLADLKRLLRHPEIVPALEVFHARAIITGTSTQSATFCMERLQEFHRLGHAALWPEIPCTGDDLRKLGIAPGPIYAELLHAVETEVLEGRVTTRDQAHRFVQSRLTR